MEADIDHTELLLLHLRDSRRRFQKQMQQLIAKYDRVFEDSPLVQMSTLTYETSQGLRIWGGKLVDRSGRQHQDLEDSPWKAEGRSEDRLGAAAAIPVGAEAEDGGVEASHHQKGLTLSVPQSPLKNELRRKYLAKVELLLQDQERTQHADHGEDQDAQGTWDPVLVSFFRPPRGSHSSGSAAHPGALVPLPHTARESLSSPSRLAHLAPVPSGLPFQAAADDSFSRSQFLEDEDLCEVTISDLYVGMLHSMSRLLSTQPACIISTKTSILQNWRPRCRARCRARMNRTYCQRRRASMQSPPDTYGPAPEPGLRVPRDQGNLQQIPRQRAGLRLEKGLAVSMGHGADRRGNWGSPPKSSPGSSTGASTGCSLDQENQLPKLKWLVSPMKLVARRQVLPRQRGTWYQEIRSRFAELHQKYCPGSRTQPSLLGSLTLDTSRPATASRDAQARRLREAFKNTIRSSLGAIRSLPPAPVSSSRNLLDPASPSPGHFLTLEPSPAASQLSARPSPVHSPPQMARYREIEKTFARLHQELCSEAPARAAVEPHSHPQDAAGQGGPPKSSLPCLHLTASAEPQLSAPREHSARSHPEFPVKRRRLSVPPLCGPWATSQDSPRPWKEVESQQPNDDDKGDERKRKERATHVSRWKSE